MFLGMKGPVHIDVFLREKLNGGKMHGLETYSTFLKVELILT